MTANMQQKFLVQHVSAVKGLEQPDDSQGKTQVPKPPEALGEAVDADLVRLMAVWEELPEAVKEEILYLAGLRQSHG